MTAGVPDFSDLWATFEGGKIVSAHWRSHVLSSLQRLEGAALSELETQLAGKTDKKNFLVDLWENHCRGIFWPGAQPGQHRFALRRLPNTVPTFQAGGGTEERMLIDMGALENPSPGLVLVTGRTGAGKTWKGSGLFAHWTRLFGGVGLTIEDPMEMPLDGNHGSGLCMQQEVPEDEMGQAVAEAMRKGIDRLMVGEIRTPGAARESLNMASTGHLTLACIHGGSPAQAIDRLLMLARGVRTDGDPDHTMADFYTESLAGSLRALIHCEPRRDGGTNIIRFDCRVMFNTVAVSGLIRNNSLGHLAREMEMQSSRLIAGLPLE